MKYIIGFYSKDMAENQSDYGYFYITFRRSDRNPLLQTNDERAFVMAQLQDMLSPRLVIQEIPEYKQLASCIDLLCFLIDRQSIRLLLFAIDKEFATKLAELLKDRLIARQMDHMWSINRVHNVDIHLRQLSGPHNALSESIRLHRLSPDWEYDRYSSIGFYLYDRRGDWMRIWRLTKLYDNIPEEYRSMLIRVPALHHNHTS